MSKNIPTSDAVAGQIPRQGALKLRPHISLEYLQSSHGIEKCDKKEKADLAVRLCQLSTLTWDDIQRAPRHGQGCETIAGTSIKAPVPECVGANKILAFRFSGKKPMVGYRDGRVFHVLWLDSKFKLYSHG